MKNKKQRKTQKILLGVIIIQLILLPLATAQSNEPSVSSINLPKENNNGVFAKVTIIDNNQLNNKEEKIGLLYDPRVDPAHPDLFTESIYPIPPKTGIGIGTSDISDIPWYNKTSGAIIGYARPKVRIVNTDKTTEEGGSQIYPQGLHIQHAGRGWGLRINSSNAGIRIDTGTGDTGTDEPAIQSFGKLQFHPSGRWTEENSVFIEDGQVGIGTQSPDGLQVDTSVTQANKLTDNVRLGVIDSPRIIFDESDHDIWQIDSYSGNLRFFKPDDVKMTIDTNGKVDITGDLDVGGTITSGGGSLGKWDDATGGINYAGGNVGIGTSTPQAKLHIGEDEYTYQLVDTVDDEPGEQDTCSCEGANNEYGCEDPFTVDTPESNPCYDRNVDVDNPNMRKYELVPGNDFVVTSDGNVGIGTDDPKNKLDINGGAVIGATYAGTSTAQHNGLLVEGKVGIGGNPYRSKLRVVGNTSITGDLKVDNNKWETCDDWTAFIGGRVECPEGWFVAGVDGGVVGMVSIKCCKI